jgi:hypothetical protein
LHCDARVRFVVHPQMTCKSGYAVAATSIPWMSRDDGLVDGFGNETARLPA